jgi:hypothetical protein
MLVAVPVTLLLATARRVYANAVVRSMMVVVMRG